ncbi:hypothetical protein ACWIUD_07655 [Helicobacter sp. 23-1044]
MRDFGVDSANHIKKCRIFFAESSVKSNKNAESLRIFTQIFKNFAKISEILF